METAQGPSEIGVCSICGERSASMCSEPVPIVVRGRQYLIEGVDHERCAACGESLFDDAQCGELDRRAVAMACADLGCLYPGEIVRLRHELGLTQAGLERALGASPGSVGRWERSEFLQGGTTDRLMRLLWAHPELLREVAEPVAREGRGPYRPRRA